MQDVKSAYAPPLSTMLFALLASFVAAAEIAYFRIACLQSLDKITDPNGLADNLLAPDTLIFIVALTLAFTALSYLLMRFNGKLFHWCFKYRFALAGILLVILVACRISGTSIGMLTNMLGGDAGDYLGIPRNIRRDEWVVNTPLALSQAQSGYAPVSNLASGGGLDLTLVYAQACWDISTLFRPFLWGYLILPVEFGLSFFWCARLIALFMVSFEFGRFITNDNRRLALVYAVLIALSPLVQWWFAVNFIAEILVSSQLLILLFRMFLSTDSSAKMILCALGMAYCACALALSLYPAWQVMLGYVMVAMCLVLLIRYIRSEKSKRAILLHAILFIVAMAVAVAFVLFVVMKSSNTVAAVTHSEYPGSRLETGGGLGELLFNYSFILYALVDPTPLLPNVCEAAAMYSLFPLGIVLGIICLAKKRDGYIIALLIMEAVLLFFGLFGFPEPLAKITLLSNVTAHRLILGTGITDILLLIRSTALMGTHFQAHRKRRTPSAMHIVVMSIIAIALGAIAVSVACAIAQPSMRILARLFSMLFIAMSVYAVLSAFLGFDRKLHRLLCVAAIVALTGLMVNPVQVGLSRFYETPLASAIESIEANDEASARDSLWIADDGIIAQACIAYGMPTFNSVALYPHIEAWTPVDPNGKFKDVYNRYAHIKVAPTTGELELELTFLDAFTAHLDTASLKTLGIAYWVTQYELEQYSDDIMEFKLAAQAGPYKIYRLNYR